jgi:hypothetical protein
VLAEGRTGDDGGVEGDAGSHLEREIYNIYKVMMNLEILRLKPNFLLRREFFLVDG